MDYIHVELFKEIMVDELGIEQKSKNGPSAKNRTSDISFETGHGRKMDYTHVENDPIHSKSSLMSHQSFLVFIRGLFQVSGLFCCWLIQSMTQSSKRLTVSVIPDDQPAVTVWTSVSESISFWIIGKNFATRWYCCCFAKCIRSADEVGKKQISIPNLYHY